MVLDSALCAAWGLSVLRKADFEKGFLCLGNRIVAGWPECWPFVYIGASILSDRWTGNVSAGLQCSGICGLYFQIPL